MKVQVFSIKHMQLITCKYKRKQLFCLNEKIFEHNLHEKLQKYRLLPTVKQRHPWKASLVMDNIVCLQTAIVVHRESMMWSEVEMI